MGEHKVESSSAGEVIGFEEGLSVRMRLQLFAEIAEFLRKILSNMRSVEKVDRKKGGAY